VRVHDVVVFHADILCVHVDLFQCDLSDDHKAALGCINATCQYDFKSIHQCNKTILDAVFARDETSNLADRAISSSSFAEGISPTKAENAEMPIIDSSREKTLSIVGLPFC